MARASVLGLLVLTAWLYSPLQAAPFVYEDRNWLGLIADWPTSWAIPGRALTMASFTATASLVGLDAGVFHLGNVALHLLCGVLLFCLVRRLADEWAGLAACALFLLHPVASGAVAYVTARGDLLVTAGTLLALVALWADRPVLRYLGVALGLWVAASAKEIGLVAVPLVAWTCWRLRPDWRLLGGLAVLGGAALGLTWSRLVGYADMVPTAGGSADPWGLFLTGQLAALWLALSRIVAPAGFAIEYDIAGIDANGRALAVWLTYGALFALVMCWRRAPRVAWTVGAVALAFLPRLLFRTNEYLTDAQVYLVWALVAAPLGLWIARMVAPLPVSRGVPA